MRQIFRYPDDSKEGVRKLKRLAARVGRTFHDQEKHDKAKASLRAFMEDLGVGELHYWAGIAMIDGRWCGATGQGGFWAVASRVVNEIASELLDEHRRAWRELHGDALFAVV